MEDSEPCMFIENPMNLIINNLYLGDFHSSYDIQLMKKYNIKHIIRIMPEFDKSRMISGIQYIHIPIKDKDTCNIQLNNLLNFTSDYIAKQLLRKENVLVHCKRGHHRSATIISAFLVKYLNVDSNIAAKYINSIRPCAMRRDICMLYGLKKFEENIQKYK
jgi:protein-tyrosine phosphatase